MVLYEKKLDKLNIYKTKIDRKLLIEYKKKHLEDIKSIILVLNDLNIKERLHHQNVAHLQTFNTKYNYIEEIEDLESIIQYINGEYDKLRPIHIIKDKVDDETINITNQDYTLLFPKENKNEYSFLDDTSILLSGILSNIQPLLYDNFLNVDFIKEELYDKKFNEVIKYELDKTISYSDILYAIDEGIVKSYSVFDEKLEKSEYVLKLLNK